MQYVAFVLCLYLALVFLASGLSKLISVTSFRGALVRQAILPKKSVAFVAWSLPVVEVGMALLLLVPEFTMWVALAIALLTGVFTFVTLRLMAQGRATECGCYGLLYRERLGWTTVLRDLTLITIALGVAALVRANRPLEWLFDTGAVALVVLAVWILAAPPIVSMLRKPRDQDSEIPQETVEWLPVSAYTANTESNAHR